MTRRTSPPLFRQTSEATLSMSDRDRIIVRRHEQGEQPSGGIIIPDTAALLNERGCRRTVSDHQVDGVEPIEQSLRESACGGPIEERHRGP